MKIRELIEELLKRNDLDSEIIVTYWDKAYFVENSDSDPSDIDNVWDSFVQVASETVNEHLEFTQTGHDLIEELEELLKEKEKGNE